MSGNSLRDQLLELGLAKKPPAQDKKRRRKPRRGSEGRNDTQIDNKSSEISLAQAYAQRQREEQRARDKSAHEKKLEAQRRKKLNDAVEKLAVPAARNDPDAPESRFFQFHGKIRKIYVTEQQQQDLTDGKMGIVSHRGRFLLLDASVVAEVRQIKPEAVALDSQTLDAVE